MQDGLAVVVMLVLAGSTLALVLALARLMGR
jgi:hypothetical protein